MEPNPAYQDRCFKLPTHSPSGRSPCFCAIDIPSVVEHVRIVPDAVVERVRRSDQVTQRPDARDPATGSRLHYQIAKGRTAEKWLITVEHLIRATESGDGWLTLAQIGMQTLRPAPANWEPTAVAGGDNRAREISGQARSCAMLRFDGDNMVKIDDKLKLARDAAAPTCDSNNVWF
jgi:hypothetical protein